MRIPAAFKYGLIGFGAGAAVSVLFLPLNFLLAFVLFLWLLVRLSGPAPGGRVKYLIGSGVGLATVAIAIVLPIKQLDKRVGPFHYGRMSVDELCQTLGRDHRVFASADRWTGTNLLDSFVTERELTRREVLQKFAREVNCELHIGYCGTGDTFLFGAHPSFTRLYTRRAQPDRAADPSQPNDSQTKQLSAAPGAGR